jgi:hypothetical protein
MLGFGGQINMTIAQNTYKSIAKIWIITTIKINYPNKL